MRKVISVLVLIVLTAIPAAAKSNLINFGYNVQNDFWGLDNVKLRSIGLRYTYVGGDTSGFYFQANPYWGMSIKDIDGTVYKFSQLTVSAWGGSFMFGYGGDINFGRFGILLGGGLYVDGQYFGNSDMFVITILAGGGLGANFYYHTSEGNFVLNAGLNLALHPWANEFFDDGSSGSYAEWGMVSVNFNIGIGWRTGGLRREEADW